MLRLLKALLEIICYLSLAIVISGILALVFVQTGGRCPQFNTGGVRCVTEFSQWMGNYAMTVTLVTAFTGFPGLLALGGLVFLFGRIRRRLKSRKQEIRPS